MSIILIALIVLLVVSLLTTFKEWSRKSSGLDHNFDQGLKASAISVVGLVACFFFEMAILPVVAAIAVIVLLLSTLQARR